jgi:hypothetical protein
MNLANTRQVTFSQCETHNNETTCKTFHVTTCHVSCLLVLIFSVILRLHCQHGVLGWLVRNLNMCIKLSLFYSESKMLAICYYISNKSILTADYSHLFDQFIDIFWQSIWHAYWLCQQIVSINQTRSTHASNLTKDWQKLNRSYKSY